jgi:multidrug efflux system membrane fusion protein
MNRAYLLACAAGSALAVFAGCDRGTGSKVTAPDAPPVPVARPVQKLVTDYVDYTGRLNAKNSVVIQPRVTGYLVTDDDNDKEKVAFFKEGDFVKKDQVLFKVDPRPYKTQLEAAQAAVAQNKAGLKYAKETNELYKGIAKDNPKAINARELGQYQAQEEQARANLDLAEANLKAAQLNLDWTVVKSPIDGQVSRIYLTPGNLVNQDVTQLTTVVSLDPMYVYFDMDEPTLLRIKTAINEGTIARPSEESDAPVLIALAGEEFAPKNKARQGTINFIDNQVNPGTGSISVRGVFPNAKPEGGTYLLVPGMFVRVRLPIGQPQEELLVIDRAITSDQGLKYLYVLDADSTVKQKPVTLGALQPDGLRVITSGLSKEDLVLVGALQQVRPGTKVQGEENSMPTLEKAAVPKVQAKGKQAKKK